MVLFSGSLVTGYRSRMVVRIDSPSKINLHLEVGPIRRDGFHELVSIVHLVDLCDELLVESCHGEDQVTITGMEGVLLEENLIFRAAEAFMKATGVRTGLRVQVTKRIPAGAGLGGGSGNAASMLRALDFLSGGHNDHGVLMDIATGLGSDVPLFLGSGASLIEGRGEIVRPLRSSGGYAGLLVHPGVHVATGDAFRWLDCDRSCPGLFPHVPVERIVAAYGLREAEKWPFHNDFSGPVEARYPQIRELRETIEGSGASLVGLSGSGSCLFALYDSLAARAAGVRHLSRFRTWEVNLLENPPQPVLQ